jgi:hypothetical protein
MRPCCYSQEALLPQQGEGDPVATASARSACLSSPGPSQPGRPLELCGPRVRQQEPMPGRLQYSGRAVHRAAPGPVAGVHPGVHVACIAQGAMTGEAAVQQEAGAPRCTHVLHAWASGEARGPHGLGQGPASCSRACKTSTCPPALPTTELANACDHHKWSHVLQLGSWEQRHPVASESSTHVRGALATQRWHRSVPA